MSSDLVVSNSCFFFVMIEGSIRLQLHLFRHFEAKTSKNASYLMIM